MRIQKNYSLSPTRLRDKIWGFAARVPRHVEILTLPTELAIAPATSPHHIMPKIGLQCKTTTIVPAILHTCAESRKHGLLFYKTCMEGCQDNTSERCGTVFINPDTDTLIIRMYSYEENNSILSSEISIELRKIKNRAEEAGNLQDCATPWNQGGSMYAICHGPNVRKGNCFICIAPAEDQTDFQDRIIKEFDEIEFLHAWQLQIRELKSWEVVGQQLGSWLYIKSSLNANHNKRLWFVNDS